MLDGAGVIEERVDGFGSLVSGGLEAELFQRKGVRLARGAETIVLLVGTHRLTGRVVPLSARVLLVIAGSG